MVYFLGIPPDRQSLIYANTDLQDNNTLEEYSIPNNAIIKQILTTRADDSGDIHLAELPPSRSPPPPEAIVVVAQLPMACVALETEPVEPNGTEPQEHVEETEIDEEDETEEDETEEVNEEPLAKKQCVKK